MKRWWSNLWERFPFGRDRAVKWLLWIGVGGVLLIALSEWTPRTNRDAVSEPVSVTADAVERALESRITDLLRSVAGVGDCQMGSPLGIPLALITVCMSVGYTIILRRIPPRYSSLSIVFYVQSFALLLFYILWGGMRLLSLSAVDLLNISTPELLKAGLSVLYLAIFASVVAFILFCYTVRQIGVTRANVFNNIRPVFTALLMWFLFDELLPIWKLIGILLIIVGLFVSQRKTCK